MALLAVQATRRLDLGYAVTTHRAQGVTTRTSHVVVTPTTTRENFYASMTRGAEGNHAYVAIDREDHEHSDSRPSDNLNVTARSVLYGVLRHVGAELSAHETITSEQEHWGSITQLVAECETIVQAARTTAGSLCSRRPVSHRSRSATYWIPTPTVHCRPSCGTPRPSTTTSMLCSHGSSVPAVWTTPTTSPP
ncbi:hypothetical protein F8O06_06995 [Pseudoclavibacter sp. CFCC 14310]|uniref:hypothetical protein n=1 Tax=Pseudoclavibacter sp. CFCC 14310 TaxID=2615180 RepID=UPI0013018988|nr:hypothetical protein [Pseudoclavibacter sp. CFCC 14310]KAB1646476.1 hypothetical protein F8O06_06995 [Pseudoclavibacter sp. CFCC 14310]